MLRVRRSHKAKGNHPRGAFVCATDTAAGKTCIARLPIVELLARSVEPSDGKRSLFSRGR